MIQLAIAPAFMGLIYMYIRDKYEKEPFFMVALAVAFGIFATFLIYALTQILAILFQNLENSPSTLLESFYIAFIASAFTEEFVKFLLLYVLIWKNPNFNEPLDGIVYAVFLALGFAGIENLMYVLNPTMGGIQTGLARAFISVPSHALFAVHMGYYFSFAKFQKQLKPFCLSFLMPYLLHAFYNFFLLQNPAFFWFPFLLLQVFLWHSSLHFIRNFLKISPFRCEIS